jgi:ABC-type dipeptide/oligopeptide/nickel transport system ATPase component
LARALINDPPLVLADEPTGNLDERNAALVQDLLLRLVSDHQKTLLLVTHDKLFAARTNLSYRLTAGKLEES